MESYIQPQEPYVIRHGVVIMLIALTISALIGIFVAIIAIDAGMTLSPVMLNEECLPIKIGFSLQFVCP